MKSSRLPAKKRRKSPLRYPKAKTENLLPKEVEKKMASIQNQLEQIRQYKDILKANGVSTDEHDKMKESRLINQLRVLQKKQNGLWVSDELYRKK